MAMVEIDIALVLDAFRQVNKSRFIWHTSLSQPDHGTLALINLQALHIAESVSPAPLTLSNHKTTLQPWRPLATAAIGDSQHICYGTIWLTTEWRKICGPA